MDLSGFLGQRVRVARKLASSVHASPPLLPGDACHGYDCCGCDDGDVRRRVLPPHITESFAAPPADEQRVSSLLLSAREASRARVPLALGTRRTARHDDGDAGAAGGEDDPLIFGSLSDSDVYRAYADNDAPDRWFHHPFWIGAAGAATVVALVAAVFAACLLLHPTAAPVATGGGRRRRRAARSSSSSSSSYSSTSGRLPPSSSSASRHGVSSRSVAGATAMAPSAAAPSAAAPSAAPLVPALAALSPTRLHRTRGNAVLLGKSELRASAPWPSSLLFTRAPLFSSHALLSLHPTHYSLHTRSVHTPPLREKRAERRHT